MIVKQITLSTQAKDQLSRLKAKTGIDQWNILCRWALCYSLGQPHPPSDVPIPADSNVQIEWHTLLGEYHELYEAAIRQRCIKDGYGSDPAVLVKYLRLHLHRGISYLAATNFIRNVTDLIRLVHRETSIARAPEGETDAAVSGL